VLPLTGKHGFSLTWRSTVWSEAGTGFAELNDKRLCYQRFGETADVAAGKVDQA
jgi:hypothetical protein